MERSKNSQEELKEIAPTLSAMQGRSGYTLPSNYFQSFTKTVIDKLDNDENANVDGYEVPADYFDQFNNKVLQRIQEVAPVKTSEHSIGRWKKRRPIGILAAASVAALLAFGIFQFSSPASDEGLEQWLAQTEVFDSEVEAMLFENEDALFTDDIDWIVDDEDEALDDILEDLFQSSDDDFIS